AQAPVGGSRRYDLHARLGGMGTADWYEKMRTDAFQRVRGLTNVTVTPQTFVNKRAYMRELGQSKMCFSPFGYGEVCWRDYEAMYSGALLIKPDMSHMMTAPEAFIPNETYVPIRWDFGDLEEVVETHLANEPRRLEIARNAYEAMHRYARSGRFVDQLERLLA
ncbi:MAG: glycosyltransferase, partial [Ramlibacter sp.]